MTREQARKILIEYQEWRMSVGKYSGKGGTLPPFPYIASDITKAIDFAIKYLYEKGEPND